MEIIYSIDILMQIDSEFKLAFIFIFYVIDFYRNVCTFLFPLRREKEM